ncbi:4-hydroxy-tetrahydrodipicolinate synthase [bacterium]|nr:MAG: 4-hydroxy-tetrahydrodipicolinate synthase [bacterium]
MFRGAITALVTPFRNGKIDEEAFRSHIDWQIAQGIHGIVPCGTTGESATLSHEEHRRVVEIAVEEAKGRVPVIAGTGSNNTSEAVALTLHAKKAGASAALMITPYYNKPSPEGMYLHYKKVAEESAFPIIVYNVPGRTAVNLAPETVARISKVPGIVGIKEATGNLEQVSRIIELCGESFDVFSGDDATNLPLLALGGCGVISVVSNLAPRDMSAMCEAFFAGDIKKARELHYKMAPLARDLFVEVNPVPVKAALGMMGRIEDTVRLPLCQLREESFKKLRKTVEAYGLAGGAK